MSPARPPAPRPRRTSARSAPAAPKVSSGTTPAKVPTSAKTPARAKPSKPTSTSRPTKSRSEVAQAPGAGPPSIAPRDRVVVEQAALRFAERAQARQRLTRRKVATAAAVVLGVVLLCWAAFFSPVLGLDAGQVDVVGVGGTVLDEVVAADDVRAVVARSVGEPLPRLDTAALRTELLGVHGVKDVHVVRDWPRGLTVTVTPRVPVAAVPVDDQVALLDADGVRLRTEPAAPEGLPVVQVPLDDTRALHAALAVVDALPPEQASQVATVAAPTQDTVTLTLADGVQVLWGSAEDNALKARVVAALRADETLADVTTIDVSAPQMPVLR